MEPASLALEVDRRRWSVAHAEGQELIPGNAVGVTELVDLNYPPSGALAVRAAARSSGNPARSARELEISSKPFLKPVGSAVVLAHSQQPAESVMAEGRLRLHAKNAVDRDGTSSRGNNQRCLVNANRTFP